MSVKSQFFGAISKQKVPEVLDSQLLDQQRGSGPACATMTSETPFSKAVAAQSVPVVFGSELITQRKSVGPVCATMTSEVQPSKISTPVR